MAHQNLGEEALRLLHSVNARVHLNEPDTAQIMVRAAGLEPARPEPRDFKSLVFTNFTTPANDFNDLYCKNHPMETT